MTLGDFIVLLIVAGLVGSIGRAIGGSTRGGCLVSIALGFVGAAIGTWLARRLGFPDILSINIGGTHFPIVWAIIGSALFVAVLGFLVRERP
ncbi:MAG: GlsB/YeaQ/YmgE family stress response membrane protein [Acidobacteriia bacterium]|nr:GlsB/YeaQ/YmgE family stress response membrane protein [Terriglobia bacterium]